MISSLGFSASVYVKINGALWRFDDTWSNVAASTPLETLGVDEALLADGLNYEMVLADEIFVFQSSDCSGQPFGYLSPYRSTNFGWGNYHAFEFEDTVVGLQTPINQDEWDNKVYKAHSTDLALSTFQSWSEQEEFGCRQGSPQTRTTMRGETTRNFVVMKLTEIEYPSWESNGSQLITVE